MASKRIIRKNRDREGSSAYAYQSGKKGTSGKKGIYFSFEAILAVTLLFAVIILLTKTYTYSSPRTNEDKITKDIINILSDTKIKDINNQFIIEKIKSGEIKDVDATILEEIGKEWILGNHNLSQEIAKNITEDILPKNVGFSISIKSNDSFIPIVSSENGTENEDNYSNSTFLRVISNKRIISGIEMEKPIEGITSKSILRSIENKTSSGFIYFGGFIGQGNVTGVMELHDFKSIKKLIFEGDINTDFRIRINNISCNTTAVPSGIFLPSSENMTITSYDLTDCKNSLIKNSRNNFTFIFRQNDINSSFIGGGYIRADYVEDQMYEQDAGNETTEYIPGIEGVINIFSGIYIPKDTYGIEIYLDLKNTQKIFFNFGNKTIYEKNASDSNVSQTEKIFLNDTYLESKIGFPLSAFYDKTVPIRFGTKNFTNKGKTKLVGNGDAVLITDLSGSMAWRFDSQNLGITRTCSDPNLGLPSTSRISVAKCINEDFVASMLNGTDGNKIGLSAYSTDIKSSRNLTDNMTVLDLDIGSYSATGSTCIACGIKKAIDILSSAKFLLNSSSVWNYTESYPKNTPPQISGKNWTEIEEYLLGVFQVQIYLYPVCILRDVYS